MDDDIEVLLLELDDLRDRGESLSERRPRGGEAVEEGRRSRTDGIRTGAGLLVGSSCMRGVLA